MNKTPIPSSFSGSEGVYGVETPIPSSFSGRGFYSYCNDRCIHVAISYCPAVFYSVLQCVAVRCSALQCVAVCCSVLQCVIVVHITNAFIWHYHIVILPYHCPRSLLEWGFRPRTHPFVWFTLKSEVGTNVHFWVAPQIQNLHSGVLRIQISIPVMGSTPTGFQRGFRAASCPHVVPPIYLMPFWATVHICE